MFIIRCKTIKISQIQSDRFQVQLSIVYYLQIWKPVVCNIQQLCMINFLPKHEQFSRVSIYKNIFLIHVLKEQIGDINFISFVIASGEATLIYQWNE